MIRTKAGRYSSAGTEADYPTKAEHISVTRHIAKPSVGSSLEECLMIS